MRPGPTQSSTIFDPSPAQPARRAPPASPRSPGRDSFALPEAKQTAAPARRPAAALQAERARTERQPEPRDTKAPDRSRKGADTAARRSEERDEVRRRQDDRSAQAEASRRTEASGQGEKRPADEARPQDVKPDPAEPASDQAGQVSVPDALAAAAAAPPAVPGEDAADKESAERASEAPGETDEASATLDAMLGVAAGTLAEPGRNEATPPAGLGHPVLQTGALDIPGGGPEADAEPGGEPAIIGPAVAGAQGRPPQAARDKKPGEAASFEVADAGTGAHRAETTSAAKPEEAPAAKALFATEAKIETSLPSTFASQASQQRLEALQQAPSAQQAPTANAHNPVLTAVPLGQVPIEIGLKSLAGINRFDIRLDPEELGRIDVRLEIGEAGEVKAHLTVDRVETLALLQRDAKTLERAFEQAGLKPSEGGVDLSLRDPSGDRRQGDPSPDDRSRRNQQGETALKGERVDAHPVPTPSTWRGLRGIDLRI